jgi:XapX domain-containing protein
VDAKAAKHAADAMRVILIRPGRKIVMESYLSSLAAGVLIGVVYSVIKVRSPAPPLIALIGLAGMLVGARAVGLVRHWLGF